MFEMYKNPNIWNEQNLFFLTPDFSIMENLEIVGVLLQFSY